MSDWEKQVSFCFTVKAWPNLKVSKAIVLGLPFKEGPQSIFSLPGPHSISILLLNSSFKPWKQVGQLGLETSWASLY